MNRHIVIREALLDATDKLFGLLTSGSLRVSVNQVFPLEDAAEAHRALEARKPTGSSVLQP